MSAFSSDDIDSLGQSANGLIGRAAIIHASLASWLWDKEPGLGVQLQIIRRDLASCQVLRELLLPCFNREGVGEPGSIGPLNAPSAHALVFDYSNWVSEKFETDREVFRTTSGPDVNSFVPVLQRERDRLRLSLSNRKRRLMVDIKTFTITLDGKSYSGLNVDAVRVLEAIAKEAPRPVTGPTLEGQLVLVRVDRVLKKLPSPLQQIVQGTSGKGYSIVLPPLPLSPYEFSSSTF
jgi:hypothetical protein